MVSKSSLPVLSTFLRLLCVCQTISVPEIHHPTLNCRMIKISSPLVLLLRRTRFPAPSKARELPGHDLCSLHGSLLVGNHRARRNLCRHGNRRGRVLDSYQGHWFAWV